MTDFTGLAKNLAAAIKESMTKGEYGGTYRLVWESVEDFTAPEGLYSFAIGGAGEEYKVKRVTAQGLAAWIARNEQEIMINGHVGYWIHQGVTYLDVTTIWAGTDYEASRERAEEIGRERGELAIWDCTHEQEIATSPVML